MKKTARRPSKYGLIAALIAVALIAGATALGLNLNSLFDRLATCMNNLPAACTVSG